MTTHKLLLLFSFLLLLTAPIELVANTAITMDNTSAVEFSTGKESTFTNASRPKKKKTKKKKARRHCEAYESFM